MYQCSSILDHLTGLIEDARQCDVTFVYALSPGLDITFSSSKEVTCLKRKLEQVGLLGSYVHMILKKNICMYLFKPVTSCISVAHKLEMLMCYLSNFLPLLYVIMYHFCRWLHLDARPLLSYLMTLSQKCMVQIKKYSSLLLKPKYL